MARKTLIAMGKKVGRKPIKIKHTPLSISKPSTPLIRRFGPGNRPSLWIGNGLMNNILY